MHKNKKAFTIIELVSIIGIIIILVVGATKYNYNTMSDKQNLEMFSNSVISQIETAMINAMTGKAVNNNDTSIEAGTGLIVPDLRKIEFAKGIGTTIITSYKIEDDRTDNNSTNRLTTNWIEDNTIKLDDLMEITNIKCSNSNSDEGENPGIIIFEGMKSSLDGDCLKGFTTIKIKFKYKNNFEEIIEYNVVSGLVERKKFEDENEE